MSAWWCGTIERVMRKLLCLLLLACALTQVGDLQGNHRITKGSVSLNGVLFATASEFESHPVARSLHLSQSNDVEVSIDGTRDQTLLVAVRPDVPDATQSLAPKATPAIH